ncbi:MAG: YbhN family protein [Hyphomicrobiales bacterium]|nr:YbhN family protein [Hyphomicrobiales bacterium]
MINPHPEPGSAPRRSARARMMADRHFWHRLGMVISLLIFCFAIFLLFRTLETLDLQRIQTALANTTSRQIGLAVGCATISYIALTGYDAVAMRQLRLKVPYRTIALGSFAAYAISFVLGFPPITGGTVRYWVYSRAGLTPGKVASLTLIASITFWLGMALVLGLALSLQPVAISALDHFAPQVNFLFGLGVLATIMGYLAFVSLRRRRMRIRGLRLELPGFVLTCCQIVLGLIDLCGAAAALYFLLPADNGLDYILFVALYVLACLLGIASNAPGGIGVFELTMLHVVSVPSPDSVLASLLIFRVVYYFLPFLLALALLGAHEGALRWRSLREAMAQGETDDDEP